MRLIYLDIGQGTTVVVVALDDNSSPSRFDGLVAQAMPIVETFEFPE